jgi:hypothetical protein
MKAKDRISNLVDSLITQGKAVLATEFKQESDWAGSAPLVNIQEFAKWRASCRLLLSLLGQSAAPWDDMCEIEQNNVATVLSMQGTLEAIREALNNDLLVRYEELVFAEAFSDLMEQAEYLFDEGYILAAGVILRAVLEERLKKMCSYHHCDPSRKRPTIVNYNTALYKAKVYDKITLKHIESMAAIGNEAAHNSPALTGEDVGRFKRDLLSFLQRYPA